jgi:hypothetical protein
VTDVLVAGAAGAVLSGAPSTALTFATGGDVLESTRAVGRAVIGDDRSDARLVLAGGAAHVAISLAWGALLGLVLPERRTVVAGATAGVLIAALDLGSSGRRLPAIRALDWRPQLLDHVAYGAVVGAVLTRRRSSTPGRALGEAGSTP